MPEKYLEGLTDDEKRDFLHHLATKEGKIAAIIGAVTAIIVSCAITIPTSIAINNQTNATTIINANHNCKDIEQLRNIEKRILIRASVNTKSLPKQQRINAEKFYEFSLVALDALDCRS